MTQCISFGFSAARLGGSNWMIRVRVGRHTDDCLAPVFGRTHGDAKYGV